VVRRFKVREWRRQKSNRVTLIGRYKASKGCQISSEFGTCNSLVELAADGKRHHFCLTMLHIKKGHISSASFFCDATRWAVSWSPPSLPVARQHHRKMSSTTPGWKPEIS
jgi:hypothetical protein